MPASRSVVSMLLRELGDFLYTLKAGPAGGHLRRPSSAGSLAYRPAGSSLTAMDLPALRPRGFWTRVVVFSITLVVYVSAAVLMAREHSLAGVSLFAVLALFSLAGLAATFWRRSPRRLS